MCYKHGGPLNFFTKRSAIMCYKHGGPLNSVPTPSNAVQKTSSWYGLFPRSYFQRVASREGCIKCQDRVCPEEVKTSLGVCAVFLLTKTVQWMVPKEQ